MTNAGETSPAALEALLLPLAALAEQAGRAILEVYARGDGRAAAKRDGSPVTAADHAADAVICAGLRQLTPRWPVVTEEQAASHAADFGRRSVEAGEVA